MGQVLMDLDKLRNSPIGELVSISGYDPRFSDRYDYFAYAPEPLPKQLNLEAATYAAVIDASTAMARADQAASLLPNPVPRHRHDRPSCSRR